MIVTRISDQQMLVVVEKVVVGLGSRHIIRFSGKVGRVKVKVAQSCLTLWDPMDYTAVHGILQARILEGVPFPSPGDLPNSGIEPRCPTLQAFFTS